MKYVKTFESWLKNMFKTDNDSIESHNSRIDYRVDLKNRWTNENINESRNPNGHWTKERCQEEALKYNSRIEFRKNSPAYQASFRKGWIDEICSHMIELKKSKGHWTKERCREEALKYNSRSEFEKNSPSAYSASRKNGWIDEICSHMVELQKPVGYWTKEKCKEEALKYNSRSDFQKNSGSVYVVSRKNGWLDEICSHMVELKKPDGHWTKERCQEEALKYNSRREFSKNSHAYEVSRKNGWIDEICSHMVELKKPSGHWTKERCQEEALKYNSRSEFEINSGSAYSASLKNGWLDEICSHMLPQGSLKKRYIYSYEFSDKSVYVGLTWNTEERKRGHENIRSTVNKYVKNNPNISYEFKIWGYYDMLEVGKMEEEKEKEYIDSGWTILNIAKTGGLGGMTLKWTKEKCQEEALKYNSRNEFQRNSGGAYNVSRKNGWLDEMCSHMVELKKQDGYWTKEKCQEEALKYNSRNEFRKNSGGAYDFSYRKGWLDEICIHMVELKKPSGHWTKERCREEALKYNSRNEFQKNSKSAYKASLKNGWLDEICGHMDELRKQKGHWTKERCQEEALKYNSRSEFKKNSPAYSASLRNGWLDEICSHMKSK
jgi:isopentenyldiphosphate isomerase